MPIATKSPEVSTPNDSRQLLESTNSPLSMPPASTMMVYKKLPCPGNTSWSHGSQYASKSLTKNPSVKNPANDPNTLQKPYMTAIAIGMPVRGLIVSSPIASLSVCLYAPNDTVSLDILSIKSHRSS